MKVAAIVIMASGLAGCATRSENISAAYVSPNLYAAYSCPQLRNEAQRVSDRAAQVSGLQDSKATGDAVATGIALVVFWPAAFLLKGDGATAGELAQLKGQMDAIEQTSIMKKCGIDFRR